MISSLFSSCTHWIITCAHGHYNYYTRNTVMGGMRVHALCTYVAPVGTRSDVCRTLILNGFSCRSKARTTMTRLGSTFGDGPTWSPTSCRRNWRSPQSPCCNRLRKRRPPLKRNRCVQQCYKYSLYVYIIAYAVEWQQPRQPWETFLGVTDNNDYYYTLSRYTECRYLMLYEVTEKIT